MNTADQYLKTIYVLQQASDSPASTGDIADRLGVSTASTNEMIGKLAERGLVDHEKYKGTVVTEEGEQRARTAAETYCVIQRFLQTVLEVDDFRDEARSIEAVLDPRVAERLDTLIDRHAECPDCFNGTTDQCEYLESPETVDSHEEIPSLAE
jgi:DtxR family Mn-dependent transcriptional regulator